MAVIATLAAIIMFIGAVGFVKGKIPLFRIKNRKTALLIFIGAALIVSFTYHPVIDELNYELEAPAEEVVDVEEEDDINETSEVADD